jgi:hypothetical protein
LVQVAAAPVERTIHASGLRPTPSFDNVEENAMRCQEWTTCLLLAAGAAAQTIVVDPGGGGNYRDLQTAIDAAPAGATIHVVGGSFGAIAIRRSLTIVCEPATSIAAPFTGSGQQPPAITLQGGGSDVAVLCNVLVAATVDGSTWTYAGPALRSSGFAAVRVYDSRLEAPRWLNITGVAWGASGIVASGAATILLERSTVAASSSGVDSSNTWVPPGVPGIDAPDASVVQLDSTVRGGSCGPTDFDWQPGPAPCPCQQPQGVGGAGVVCRHGFEAGSTVSGGSGSVVTWQYQPWGQQPDGPPFVATSWTVHQNALRQAAPLRLGTVHQLAFSPTVLPSLMGLGAPQLPPATVVGVPHVVIDPLRPLDLAFLPVGATSFSLAVPNAPDLIGFELAEQRFDLPTLGIVATNGVLGVVRP